MASDNDRNSTNSPFAEGTPLRILTALGTMFYVSVGGAAGLVFGEFLFDSPLEGVIVGALAGFLFDRLGAGPLERRLQRSESWPRWKGGKQERTGLSIGRWLDSWKYFTPPTSDGDSSQGRDREQEPDR